jgi:F-type H+-transporting ATPase subunit gamma
MGQNTKEIKKRINSVKNTRKITRTMEMVSTAKSKKAQDRVQASKPYNQKIKEIIAHLAQGQEGGVSSPLLSGRDSGKPYWILAIASNRGLCGAYNTNVLKLARDTFRELQGQGKEVKLEVVGKKAISFCRFNGLPVEQSHTDIDDKIAFEDFDAIPTRILQQYLNNQIGKFFVVYTKYLSAARQVATVEQLLPFSLSDLIEDNHEVAEQEDQTGFVANYLYEPDAQTILDSMLPYAFKVNLFQAFLEAFTSEHIYRRIAMKSATDAASDMIKDLTSSYNRARQSKITNEIAEIISGASALE